ncbi:alpha/beta hydrolase family protein [Winogradskyella psychrotolerans]|uniref:alpha/beta hydrolase family protein n=1 Tax=Winogradskyella psychrotolerans TaxID=1344585 RepID=UPI001C076AA7|nr:prolyl oligopeptidase family serine peptidase [Winogradskyella psychrotolerans]MBU2928372.1 prolyl oligopeptidase family serine peptidase [Winogradskyella psychrotolerans]
MKNKILKLILFITTLFFGIIIGIYLTNHKVGWTLIKNSFFDTYQNDAKDKWGNEFDIVNIESSVDKTIQKSYSYKSKSLKSQPLIVSLHTWSGDYAQYDALAQLCLRKDINYIHPNFRGPNNTQYACSSELVLSDIDDAISYAIENFNVDTSQIFVIGLSGGGYATLSTFMKSKHKIRKFSAWASISDLISWHNESEIRNTIYAQNILDCTESKNKLNIQIAKRKSPIYWHTPVEKLKNQELHIFAGVYDGIKGCVPITHSINFYNKLLTDLYVEDSTKYVTLNDKLNLLENRKSLGEYGRIADRDIFFKKEYQNISLTIFDGDHEMLTEFAFNHLLNTSNED